MLNKADFFGTAKVKKFCNLINTQSTLKDMSGEEVVLWIYRSMQES